MKSPADQIRQGTTEKEFWEEIEKILEDDPELKPPRDKIMEAMLDELDREFAGH